MAVHADIVSLACSHQWLFSPYAHDAHVLTAFFDAVSMYIQGETNKLKTEAHVNAAIRHQVPESDLKSIKQQQADQ